MFFQAVIMTRIHDIIHITMWFILFWLSVTETARMTTHNTSGQLLMGWEQQQDYQDYLQGLETWRRAILLEAGYRILFASANGSLRLMRDFQK